MKTINVYTIDELSDEAREKALQTWKDDELKSGVIPWGDEIIESMTTLFKMLNVKLIDYSIGAYSRSEVKFELDENVYNLSGARAMAWIENNLLSKLRIPYTGEKRRYNAQFGSAYRPGMIKPCPLTGVCFDEDFISEFRKDAFKNCIGDALYWTAATAERLMNASIEDAMQDENIMETMRANDYTFFEDGEMI